MFVLMLFSNSSICKKGYFIEICNNFAGHTKFNQTDINKINSPPDIFGKNKQSLQLLKTWQLRSHYLYLE